MVIQLIQQKKKKKGKTTCKGVPEMLNPASCGEEALTRPGNSHCEVYRASDLLTRANDSRFGRY